MRIAIAMEGTVCASHFGGSKQLAVVTVDENAGRILAEQFVPFPPHTPGAYPAFIIEQGVDLVIAGGIGERAVIMLASAGIRTITDAGPLKPGELVRLWLDGKLKSGPNPCGHVHGKHDGHGPHHGEHEQCSHHSQDCGHHQ